MTEGAENRITTTTLPGITSAIRLWLPQVSNLSLSCLLKAVLLHLNTFLYYDLLVRKLRDILFMFSDMH